jgi:hypothetical protein
MKTLTKLTSSLLILNLLLPPSVFAQGSKERSIDINKAQKAAATALNDLQRAGTEFYTDAAKKHPLNLMDLRLNQKGATKIYAVTPYDRELRSSVGVSQTIQATQDGNLKLTLEILKNESKGLTSFPVRALKTITLDTKNTADSKIKLNRTIQAALAVAKNQMSLGKKNNSAIEKLFAKIADSLIPSANAGTLKIIGGVIVGIFAIAMIVGGIALVVETAGSSGGYINFGPFFVMLGVGIAVGGLGLGYVSYDLITD